jgi:hypothetical protein
VEDLIKGNVINDSETKVKAKVAKHAIIYIYIYISTRNLTCNINQNFEWMI